MADLNVAGIISIIIFYSIILAIGIFTAWKKNKGIHGEGDDIILAGRKIGLIVGAFTMTATWVSGGYINGTAESVYTNGLVWVQAPWCYALSLIFGGIFFAKQMREKEYVTMLDPLQDQYGKIMGAILYIPAFLGETFWSASMLSALGSTLSVILQINITLAMIVSAFIVIGYTCIGGLYSVAYTDVVQLSCLAVGLFLTLPFALTHTNVENIASTKSRWLGNLKGYETGKWIDYSMLLICGGIPWQVYFQRILSSKSPNTARMLSFIGAFGCIIMSIPAVFLGAVAKSADWTVVGNSSDFFHPDGSIKDSRLTLPLVLQYLTPPGVAIVALGAVSAAVMSSADSSILSVSTMFGQNIYKVIFRPRANSTELSWVIRTGIFVVGLLATLFGLMVPSVHTLFYLCSDLVFVILFPQLLAALHIPSANTYGSITAYIVALFFRLTGGEKVIGLPALIRYPMYMNNEQYFPFRTMAMVISLATLIIISHLTNFLFYSGRVSTEYDFLNVVERRENRFDINNRASVMMAELNQRLSLREGRDEEGDI